AVRRDGVKLDAVFRDIQPGGTKPPTGFAVPEPKLSDGSSRWRKLRYLGMLLYHRCGMFDGEYRLAVGQERRLDDPASIFRCRAKVTYLLAGLGAPECQSSVIAAGHE